MDAEFISLNFQGPKYDVTNINETESESTSAEVTAKRTDDDDEMARSKSTGKSESFPRVFFTRTTTENVALLKELQDLAMREGRRRMSTRRPRIYDLWPNVTISRPRNPFRPVTPAGTKHTT